MISQNQQQNSKETQQQKSAKFTSKLLVAYLYFIQGLYLGIPSSLIFTYSKIPQYSVLSLFAAVTLPFSFKFISAPFIQKYTNFNYGRRKTWVVLSLIIAGFIMYFLASSYTHQQHQTTAAHLLFIIIMFVSLKDISVDALAIKQLNSPQLASLLQSVFQILGVFVSNLIFLELVSQKPFVDELLNIKAPIMSVSTFFKMISVGSILPAIFIHFAYNEKITQSEKLQHQKGQQSLIQVIKRYKYFFLPKYRVCRQALFFVLYPHGLGYFMGGFSIQLVKNYGFNKELLTTISNLSIIPILIFTYFLSKIIQDTDSIEQQKKQNKRSIINKFYRLHHYQFKFLIPRFVFVIFLFLATPYLAENTLFGISSILVLIILANSQFLVDSTLVNTHASVAKYSAMYATIMASVSNFGRNTTIQLQVIGLIGYRYATMFGLIYFGVILLTFKKVHIWIRQGQVQDDSIQEIKKIEKESSTNHQKKD